MMSFREDTTILSIFYDLCSVPVFCWVKDEGQTPKIVWGTEKLHPCEADDSLRKMLEESTQGLCNPVILFENEFVFFGLLPLEGEIICLGPVVRTTVTSVFEQEYSNEHRVGQKLHLSKLDTGVLAKWLALLYCHYWGSSIQYDDIFLKSREQSISDWKQEGDWEIYQLAQSENERVHLSGIDFENRLIDIVERGDTDAVKKLMAGNLPEMENVGEVARSQKKQSEYLTVSLLTLLTRAAIEGGVNSEKAHELGDIFLRELETASMRGEAFTLIGYRAMYDFTEQVKQVREAKRNQSYIVDACKDYVAKHLRKNLEVGEIAPAIGVSRTYLAHKFKESEEITVQQYIQRERCHHAANLLQYSDYPVSLIAEYMCFSSQSYFTSCFKQWYGMTPKEYRLQYQRI